ncbi:flagellar hook-basal body complex protein FliE [Bacteriovoracaceae bacterium]|nr:flagellar hook-basal body complex protein FliE [Bacteriovoracaceae bacterium]
MSIQNYAGLKSILNNSKATEWKSTVEFGNRVDINKQGGEIEGSDNKTFGQFLTDQITEINSLQQEANVAMEKLASGESNNLQETLLAVEKADIAFKTMNQIRHKVIDAYRDIMKMQI